MLKFTNASNGQKGNLLFINREWIVSVYEFTRRDDTMVTAIYGGPTGLVWEVEESITEVAKIINNY